jgi:hypothetical protein
MKKEEVRHFDLGSLLIVWLYQVACKRDPRLQSPASRVTVIGSSADVE